MRYLQDLNQAAFGNALNLSDVVKINYNIEIRMYISPSYIVIKNSRDKRRILFST